MRALTGLLLVPLLALGPALGADVVIACSLVPVPRVVAIGAGEAWVAAEGDYLVYSLETGALRYRLSPSFQISDVRFDARRSEFWGHGQDRKSERPLLWASSGAAGGFTTQRVPARVLYTTIQSPGGGRIFAGTTSTAELWEEVYSAAVALGTWKGGRVRFTSLAPPLDAKFHETFLIGPEVVGPVVIDLETARPILPNLRGLPDLDLGSWIASLGGSVWLLIDGDTLRGWVSRDGAQTWTESASIPGSGAPEDGGSLSSLASDPFHPGHVCALVESDGEANDRLEVWLFESEMGRWRRLALSDSGSEGRFQSGSPGEPLWEAGRLWLQSYHPEADGGWEIQLLLYRPGEDDRPLREVRLRPPSDSPRSGRG